MIAEGYGLDAGATAHHLRLDPGQVAQALRYASTNDAEVQAALDENWAVTPEKLRSSLPPGAWVEIG